MSTLAATLPVPLLVAVAGVFGLLIGSFLNVVIYRVPNGMSLVAPASACPRCGSAIRPYDNIPVLSWLLLRGRCRACREPISARYPLVEAGVGAFFAVVMLWLVAAPVPRPAAPVPGDLTGADLLVLVAFLYLAAVSVALALIDLDLSILPNAIVLPSYPVALVLLGAAAVSAGDWAALLRAAVGMAVLWVAYLLMALAYRGGMGFGDVKLAGLLGLYLGYLGWGQLAVGAFAAFLFGGLFAALLMLLGRARRGTGIPFGPWMLTGAWVGIFFGHGIWSSYLLFLGLA